MSFLDDIENVIEATEALVANRLAALGEMGTAGPERPQPEVIVEVEHPPAPRWDAGWWSGARRLPAHPGRIGGAIKPFGTVVHTTDMLPDEWPALLAAWTGRAGEGACAHFLIGRDEQHGVVQFAPIVRNGNHAGGNGHGVIRVAPPTTDLHPNLVMVGIEVHCAGGVVRLGGEWRLVEGGVAHGAALPDADVDPDPIRPGRGFHRVTDYQRAVLKQLLEELEGVLATMPPGAVPVAFGEAVPSWGTMPTARVVGHLTLDPVHRADPWPATMAWLKARAAG